MLAGKLVLLTAIFLMTACTAAIQAQREQEYQEALTGYVGKNIEQIFEEFGYADSISETPNGNRVFVYSSFHINSSSVSCTKNKDGTQSCSGGSVSERWCKTYLEVDSQNFIVNFSNKGNSCGSCSRDSLCFR